MTQGSNEAEEPQSDSLFDKVHQVLGLVETYLQQSIDDLNIVKGFLSTTAQEPLNTTIDSIKSKKDYVSELRETLPEILDEGDDVAVEEAKLKRFETLRRLRSVQTS